LPPTTSRAQPGFASASGGRQEEHRALAGVIRSDGRGPAISIPGPSTVGSGMLGWSTKETRYLPQPPLCYVRANTAFLPDRDSVDVDVHLVRPNAQRRPARFRGSYCSFTSSASVCFVEITPESTDFRFIIAAFRELSGMAVAPMHAQPLSRPPLCA